MYPKLAQDRNFKPNWLRGKASLHYVALQAHLGALGRALAASKDGLVAPGTRVCRALTGSRILWFRSPSDSPRFQLRCCQTSSLKFLIGIAGSRRCESTGSCASGT